MRCLIAFFITILFSSCDYIEIKNKNTTDSDIVAIVNTEKLFKNDLKTLIGPNYSKQDSALVAKSAINNWALQRLLLDKAKTNTSQEALESINSLVNDYKESLLINSYKEQLIKQKLDTIVLDEEITDYYKLNKDNFKLNEDLVKIKYLYLDDNLKNKTDVIDLFTSTEIEDAEVLEKMQINFKHYHLNDSVWVDLDKVMLKLPFAKEKLLKKTKLIKKQDTLGLYLASIKDVLQRNETAPLSYIKTTLKEMILHKRKIELIRDIEKIIIKDATKNNNFKTY